MARQNQVKSPRSRKESISARELDNLLDILLALDRTVVELSLHVYKIPRRHRHVMREQNRRLHDAVRERLPRSAA